MRELLLEYKKSREGLNKMIDRLGDSDKDNEDRKTLNSMKRDVDNVINWLMIGYDPDNPRGVNIKYAYDVTHYPNMDLLPDMREPLQKERESLRISKEQRKIIYRLFETLTDRERDCFILHMAQGHSMQETGDKLGISKSSVQVYIDRVRSKIKSIK